MLADAEKYATADQEKRQNIEVKNQAETLCFEAEKELELLKDKISEEQQTSTKQLITNIRQDIESENFESLKSILEELKLAMKNMADTTQSESDSMGDLNDL
jgi:molecular chaperone DnaK